MPYIAELIFFLLVNFVMLYSASRISSGFFQIKSISGKFITGTIICYSQITITTLLGGVLFESLNLFLLCSINLLLSLMIMTTVKLSGFLNQHSCFKSINSLWKQQGVINRLLLVLLGIHTILVFVKVSTLPPLVWDSFTYHLPPVMEWIRLDYIPLKLDLPVERVNYFPLGFKLISLWFFKGIGDFALIVLPNFIMGILLVVTSYRVMRVSGVSRNSAVRYSVLIYSIPSVLLGLRTCQDHIALTTLSFMVIYLMINIYRGEGRNLHILFGLAVGALIGIKSVGFQILGVALMVGIIVFRRRVKVSDIFRKYWKRVAVSLGYMVVVGGFWYIKNFINSGTFFGLKLLRFNSKSFFFILAILTILISIYLIKFNKKILKGFIITISGLSLIFGMYFLVKNYSYLKPFLSHYPPVTFDGNDKEFASSLPKEAIFKNLLYSLYRVRDTGASYSPDLPNISGFGVQFFSFGLLAYILIPALLYKGDINNSIRIIYWFSVILLLMYYFYYFSPYNYRLFTFFAVSGLILWAYILDKLIYRKFYRDIAGLLVIVMVVFNCIVCFAEGLYSESHWKFGLLKPLYTGKFVSTSEVSPLLQKPCWEYIREFVKPDEGLAYWGGDDSWLLPYYEGERKIIISLRNLKELPLKTVKGVRVLEFDSEFVNYLKVRGIKWVHYNPQGLWPYQRVRIEPAGYLINVSKGFYYIKN